MKYLCLTLTNIQDFKNKALLLMSSGNYGGLDFDEVKNLII